MKPLLTSARCLGAAALLVLLPVSSLPSLAAATTVSPYFQSFVFGGIDRDLSLIHISEPTRPY